MSEVSGGGTIDNGVILKCEHWEHMMDTPPEGAVIRGLVDSLFPAFDDYDDAVAAEVAFLDALRVRGVLGHPI